MDEKLVLKDAINNHGIKLTKEDDSFKISEVELLALLRYALHVGYSNGYDDINFIEECEKE